MQRKRKTRPFASSQRTVSMSSTSCYLTFICVAGVKKWISDSHRIMRKPSHRQNKCNFALSNDAFLLLYFIAAKARRDVENEKAVVQVVLGK
jgi:hypothetical protein